MTGAAGPLQMIPPRPLPWLTRAVNAPNTRNLADRLESLAAAYHMLYQHSPNQKVICPACRALDPNLVRRHPPGSVVEW